MEPIIEYLNTFPPLIFSLLMFLVAYCSVVAFAHFFGEGGLYAFIAIASIGANIQVLKLTHFGFFNSPVALGTELFASTYLATDILTEWYGKKKAQRGILLGFASMLFWTIVVIITLSFVPLQDDPTHRSMKLLFLPAPILLFSSLLSYLLSQFLDVHMFSFLRKKTGEKNLWIRNNVSTLIAALVDTIVFSFLAFFALPRIFSTGYAVDFSTLLTTFIGGTYIFRIFSSLIDTPFMYFAKRIITTGRIRETKIAHLKKQ